MKTCRLLCLFALIGMWCAPGRAQKAELWIEVRSPNFVVVSNASEKQARSVAEQFELFRALVQRMLPKANIDLGKPLTILAAKNEKSLKELLPEYWEQKGRVHPAGMFVPGQEKLYVALRMDVYGDYPYQIIYHEFMHAILRRNFQNIPLWMNEGFAELFGYSVLGGKQAGVGRPSVGHLQQLQEQKLLPLETLLTVDHNSPHYNEGNKASVFYAQSWVLTHYLMLEANTSQGSLLDAYLRNLAQSANEKEAAARTFGDLTKFARDLEAYTRRSSFRYFVVKAPLDIDEKSFPVRVLSPAESAALRGDFHVHTNRPREARALLDEALRLDPENAPAYESIGVLHLRNQDREQAAEWFEKAVARDSRSFLAHYYAAMLAVERGASGSFETTEKHLRRAIELNSQFAPAYATLASFYGFREDRLEEALQMARKAAQLEPGTLHYHLNIANILLRMRRADDAIQLGEKIQRAAREPAEQRMAENFLNTAREYRDSLSRYEAARREADDRATRRAAELSAEAARPASPPEPAAANELSVDPTGTQATARGLITNVTCPGPSQMRVTMKLRQATLTLLAAERAHVPYYIGVQTAAPRAMKAKIRQFDPCESLEGLRVEIIFRPEKEKLTGQIMSIELLQVGATEATAARNTPAVPVKALTPPTPGSVPRVGWAEGKVLSVTCSEPMLFAVIDLGGAFKLKLRAPDYHKLEFAAAPGVSVPGNFQPCTQLKGLTVDAKYHVADAKDYSGDIVSVQIKK